MTYSLRRLPLTLLVCVVVSAVSASSQASGRFILGHRVSPQDIPLGWLHEGPVDEDRPVAVRFTLHLQQQGLSELTRTHRAVSDPTSPQYRKFLTQEDVARIVRPSPDSFHAVYSWLNDHGIDKERDTDLTGGGDAIRVHVPAAVAADLFDTAFHHFRHVTTTSSHADDRHRVTRVVGQYSIPTELAPHIVLVTGVSELIHDNHLRQHSLQQLLLQHRHELSKQKESRGKSADAVKADLAREILSRAQESLQGPEAMLAQDDNGNGAGDKTDLPDSASQSGLRSDFFLNPHTMREHAGVPRSTRVTEDIAQAIVAFNGQFSHRALRNYIKIMDIPTSDVVHQVGPDIEPVHGRNESEIEEILAHSIESDLDIQYLVGVGRGARTEFWNMEPGKWVLDFAQQASDVKEPPSVFSISYGFPEMESCAVASKACSSLSLDASKYMERANVEFQKLGARGVSVIVAAGDDGAPGRSKNCPASGGDGALCSSLLFTRKEGKVTQYCTYPSEASHCEAIRHPDCKVVLKHYAEDLARDPTCLGSIGDGGTSKAEPDRDSKYVTVRSSCECKDMPVKTFQSCKAEGFKLLPERGPVFAATFPATSPYVTSVGATQFTRDSFPACKNAKGGEMLCPVTEVAASRAAGNRFTTGGGFSAHFSAESWQSEAIDAYVNERKDSLPPSAMFDKGKRGFPDVSMPGTNCLFNNPVSLDINDGTSCSTPAFAGLISLLNSRLKGGGDSPLGFLNPWLYQMGARAPETFNDVREGNNCCTRDFCCSFCFTAGKGWDPVTGLGTPNFIEILGYMDKLGPAATGWAPSTAASTSQTGKSSGGGSAASADSRVVYSDVLMFALVYVCIPFLACALVVGAIIGWFWYKAKNPKGWRKLNTYD